MVMQGYLLMVDEAIDQLAARGLRATHVFLQAGVGGFAAATAAHFSLRCEGVLPRFVVVEPERAACLFRSAAVHRRIRIEAAEPTVMSMLECYEPSLIAWRILERLADAFMTIGETPALRAMHRLAFPDPSDPFVLSGESGGVGLAGLVECASDASSREALGIDNHSVILTFNTEGATDRALYESLLARAPK
jgi:diaminopropionate ammonia-lyase